MMTLEQATTILHIHCTSSHNAGWKEKREAWEVVRAHLSQPQPVAQRKGTFAEGFEACRALHAIAAHEAAKPVAQGDYERAVIEQAMMTECVSVTGRDPYDVISDIIQWHVSNATRDVAQGEAVGEYLANVDEYGGVRWTNGAPEHGTKLYATPTIPTGHRAENVRMIDDPILGRVPGWNAEQDKPSQHIEVVGKALPIPFAIDRTHENQAFVTVGFDSVDDCTAFIKALSSNRYVLAASPSAGGV